MPGGKLELALLNRLDDPPVLEIVKRPNAAVGFVVIARRWVVERTFAWARALQKIGKGLGNLNIILNRLADNRSNQTADQICGKDNEIMGLVLSQTLKPTPLLMDPCRWRTIIRP